MASHAASNAPIPVPPIGRLTRSREFWTSGVHVLLCLLGLIPIALGLSPAWRAAGLGLWFPGAGFLALGPWGILATILTLLLFVASVIAWFGSGMVVAPVIVWTLSLAIAALVAPDASWRAAPYVVAGLTIAALGYMRIKRAKKDAADIATLALRNRFLPAALARLREERVAVAEPGTRELDERQLQHLRYALDRALQPIDQFNGFDKIDQFQTAATRYQINALAYSIALSQCHYTPNFHGYVSQAQRNLIEKYLEYRVWNYWIYESMWGHLNFTNFDPVGKDNIMLTGYYGIQVGLYMSNTGDMRYMEPGSLTFRRPNGTDYAHRFQDLGDSISDNWDRSKFCLYPCEPNWIYPICNYYGMTSVTLQDRLMGSANARQALPRWMTMLDTELTDKKGTPVPLRSSLTAWVPPFPTTDGMYVPFANCFIPERAEKMWGTARVEMNDQMIDDAEALKRLTLPGAGIDFGNYGKGHGMNYAQFGNAAREMGDDVFAVAAERALDADGGLEIGDGVARYTKVSNMGNAYAAMARVQRRNDLRVAVCEGPPATALTGPILAAAPYPDVLVAKAFSRGQDLELVLRPGGGPASQTIGLERLVPGASYAVSGDATSTIVADGNGRARLTVDLAGRVALHVFPLS